MSSAAVSDATTQPRSSRPSDSGRTPYGSRAAYRVFSSMNVRQNAPRTVGSSSSAACSSVESAAPWASSAPRMSESVVAAVDPAGVDQAGVAGAGGQFGGVDQVAVVAQRDAGARRGVAEHRLGVLPGGGAGGGVAAVPDRDVALHRGQRLLVEYLADQAEILEHQHLRAVGDGDAGGLLAAVLQCVQAVIGELGHLFAGRPYAEYAALFSWFVIGLLAGHDRAAPWGAVGDAVQSTVISGSITESARRFYSTSTQTTSPADNAASTASGMMSAARRCVASAVARRNSRAIRKSGNVTLIAMTRPPDDIGPDEPDSVLSRLDHHEDRGGEEEQHDIDGDRPRRRCHLCVGEEGSEPADEIRDVLEVGDVLAPSREQGGDGDRRVDGAEQFSRDGHGSNGRTPTGQSLSATTGSHAAISGARAPDRLSLPPAAASSTRSSPVASSSHVRGSVSTTLGGLPRVCRGPEMHWTATNGGTRTSTLAPGAIVASVRAVSRTASASSARSGAGRVSSRKPVGERENGGTRLRRICGAADGHTLLSQSVIGCGAARSASSPSTREPLTSTIVQVLCWRHDVQTP